MPEPRLLPASRLPERRQRPSTPRSRAAFGSRARPASAASCRLAVRLAAGRFEVSSLRILARRRGSPGATRARQAAMYLAHVALGVSLTAVAEEFDRDRTTVAHACRRVEDRRDDPAFDAALADLELAAQIVMIRDDAEGA